MTEFECNMDSSYADFNCIDEWGAAFVWLNEFIGVEYNFCIDCGKNYSAIYLMTCQDGQMSTDYNEFVHYEINFNRADWKELLKDEMIKVAVYFTKKYRLEELYDIK